METPMTAETTQRSNPVISADKLIRDVKRATYRKTGAEDKIRIVLEGFRREQSVTDICRREGIAVSVYYKWLKEFMEAGKSRLKGNSLREANSDEVQDLRRENENLKKVVGEQVLELHLLKKSLAG
jgi:transposase